MNNKLFKLATLLESEGLINEAAETCRLAVYGQDTSELDMWQEAWASVSEPIPEQFPGRAIKFLMDGFSGLAESGKELQDADPESVQRAGRAIKSLSSKVDFDYETLKKFSQIGKDPEITREANAAIGEASWLARSIPLVGPIFSGMFALKNLYYGLKELGSVLSFSESLGVPWYVALKHVNLRTLAERHAEDPEKITIVDQLSKSVQVLWDEVISFVINIVDFIKDCLFVLVDTSTLGGAIFIDVGLSFAFMAVEMAVEHAFLKPFKEVIADIRSGVSDKFREILMSAERDPNREAFSFGQFGREAPEAQAAPESPLSHPVMPT
jgi:hypothetical protein